MKITITETIIEATAAEINASQTLGGKIATILSRAFTSGEYEDGEDEDDVESSD